MHPPAILTDETAIAWFIVSRIRKKGGKPWPWSPRDKSYFFYRDSFRSQAREFYLAWINQDPEGQPILRPDVPPLVEFSTASNAEEMRPKKAIKHIAATLGYLPKPLTDAVSKAAGIQDAPRTAKDLAEAIDRAYHRYIRCEDDDPSYRLYKSFRAGGHTEEAFTAFCRSITDAIKDYVRTRYLNDLLHNYRKQLLAEIVTRTSRIFDPEQCGQIVSAIVSYAGKQCILDYLGYSKKSYIEEHLSNLPPVVWRQGPLTVLEELPVVRGEGKRRQVIVQCECGAITEETASDFKHRKDRRMLFSCGGCGRPRTIDLSKALQGLRSRHNQPDRKDASGWFADVHELHCFLGLPSRPADHIHRTLGHHWPYSRANAIWREAEDNSSDHRHRQPALVPGVGNDQWSRREIAERIGMKYNTLTKLKLRNPKKYQELVSQVTSQPKDPDDFAYLL